MNITGLVRVDLSPWVAHKYLQIGDHQIRELWPLFGDGDGAFELHIGDAVNVRWDCRIVDLVSPTAELVVTGTSVDGVQQATHALRRMFDRSRGAA